MTMIRSLRAGVLAAVAAASSACADAPGAPALLPTRPNLEVVDPSVIATAVARDVPLAHDRTFRFQVPAAGGNYTLPGTGLRIIIPGGALRGKGFTLTVTAIAGPMIAYSFEPHGTVFALPLMMTQDMSATSYSRLQNKAAVEVGYFADRSKLDLARNQALISEFLPAAPDWTGHHLRFQVRHFSGYMMSSGRTTLQ